MNETTQNETAQTETAQTETARPKTPVPMGRILQSVATKAAFCGFHFCLLSSFFTTEQLKQDCSSVKHNGRTKVTSSSTLFCYARKLVPPHGPPIRHWLLMSTKPVNTNAITATHAGRVRHGVGHKAVFSGHGRRNAAEDPRLNILQLNNEELTANTISVIEQLAYENKPFIIVLPETHRTTADKLVISNFSLAGSVLSRNHGLDTFVHERLEWSLVGQSPEQSKTEWLCVNAAGYKNINVYKHPRPRFAPTAIPTFPHPSLYAGDFNCQHFNCGCNKSSAECESLDFWATSNNIGLLYNPKETASFFSRPWNVATSPYLAFVSFRHDSRLPDDRVLGKFPRSQHRLSLITPPKLKVTAHSDPVKFWNFARLIGSIFGFSQINPLRECHLRTHQTLKRHTRIFVRA